MGLIFLVSLFISASILIESIGVWFRYIGAANDEPTVGYSTHVRAATLGRFFILISAPMLGFFVDKGFDPNMMALIGSLVFSFVAIFLGLNIFLKKYEILYFFYKFLNPKSKKEIVPIGDFERKVNVKFVFLCAASFSVTASGIIVVNYIAAKFPEKRAMIVQMSAFITMSGTLLHVFFVDPVLARACDKNINMASDAVNDFLLSRFFSSIILLFIFIMIFFL